MKKRYNKPVLKNTMLLCNASLLTASAPQGVYDDDLANGSDAFSNEEGKHDIWGNDGNGIW